MTWDWIRFYSQRATPFTSARNGEERQKTPWQQMEQHSGDIAWYLAIWCHLIPSYAIFSLWTQTIFSGFFHGTEPIWNSLTLSFQLAESSTLSELEADLALLNSRPLSEKMTLAARCRAWSNLVQPGSTWFNLVQPRPACPTCPSA